MRKSNKNILKKTGTGKSKWLTEKTQPNQMTVVLAYNKDGIYLHVLGKFRKIKM